MSERPLLDTFGLSAGGSVRASDYAVDHLMLAAPLVRRVSFDRAVAIRGGEALVHADRGSVVSAASLGNGVAVAVGGRGPFLNGGIGGAENGRLAAALANNALIPGGSVAFDEYHHGVRAEADAFALVTQTWPGRALGLASTLVFVYAVLTGRRLGAPVPLDPRPPRSSLEYVRSFGALVRRSGRDEIARRRLQRELRHGLAVRAGLDPALSFEQLVEALAVHDPARAAEARAIDDVLAHPQRGDALLRVVPRIERLASPTAGGAQ